MIAEPHEGSEQSTGTEGSELYSIEVFKQSSLHGFATHPLIKYPGTTIPVNRHSSLTKQLM